MNKTTAALVIANIVVGCALGVCYKDLKKAQERAQIESLDLRLIKISSDMWKLKTKVEFPGFPRGVGIKGFPFHKKSLMNKME